MEGAKKFPACKWAQRADCVLLTIELPDSENIKIDIIEEENRVIFNAVANGHEYELNLRLFEAIVKAESKWNTKGRNVIMNLSKKDKE